MVFFLFSCQKKETINQNATGESYEILESTTGSTIKDLYLPDTLYFAGERVPMEEEYVREAIQKELMVNAFRHSKVVHLLKTIPRWKPLIDSTLKVNKVPRDFLYLAVTESYLENVARSGAGASGMWQFMPKTGKEYDLTIAKDYDMRRNPWLATQAACSYLNKSYLKFNNWTLVAASYNRGVKGISRALENQKVNSFYDLYLNTETSRYIFRIISFKLILENPEKYGFLINKNEKYKPYQFEEKKITQSIPSLVDYAKNNKTTYKKLRVLNPWLDNASSFSLKIKKGDTLILRTPKQKSHLN